jgi:hypothetical protein
LPVWQLFAAWMSAAVVSSITSWSETSSSCGNTWYMHITYVITDFLSTISAWKYKYIESISYL